MTTRPNVSGIRRAKNNLRVLRLKRGMSQQELAMLAHTSPSVIVWIERYSYYPTPELRQRIAQALGVGENEIWPQENSNAA